MGVSRVVIRAARPAIEDRRVPARPELDVSGALQDLRLRFGAVEFAGDHGARGKRFTEPGIIEQGDIAIGMRHHGEGAPHA